ncbi:serine/threonine-protein kinase Warts [Monomorium pharaonis]|uniref:serine/threonine-protein kinase Warts n=1 Tax=Monomorium pharaonis TaxID=307658 RepID=UPI00063F30F8|nr:serine/threonine-protein kinase Warts [Monomorium pharaonis]XP_036146628.1 serine/threonine-protein kinase Warts [Monomorium pharaonis]XP_036146629.1 serine/threonine-protein kinase Warts [Monomorium pharaonis]XP_036146630.1 serine/threonine-protein kinase Warts [Monomorium pharaonis]XP_036146631.1 serine/threonine-protein kinase Warts [Monomorium pharaonis]XP_036146632.1 serine/threonine-protein kinase Warts [Monomorium pharaonis]XP_036146633.1 serine/threonine-protein kinase Warts [Monom
MNPPAAGKSSTRGSGYHQKALAEIRNSLLPFANIGGAGEIGSSAASTISTISTTSGISSASGLSGLSGASGSAADKPDQRQVLGQLLAMGYSEEIGLRALKFAGWRLDAAIEYLKQAQGESLNGLGKLNTKLIRKPSLERELNLQRGSPALDSGAGSSRSDSPRLTELSTHPQLSRQYSPSNFVDREPPPPPPPRCSSTPPPPPPPHGPYSQSNVPTNMQQMLKRMSPAPVVPTRSTSTASGTAGATSTSVNPPQRGTSPVANANNSSSRQPMIVQNGPQVQQQLTQQMQALSIYQTSNSNTNTQVEPPPPYPIVPSSTSGQPVQPPSYSVSMQNRQSPTQSQQDYRKSPSSGIYSGPTSAGTPSPITVSAISPTSTQTSMARPTPLQAWGARQAKTQPPIIMQSVKSTQVQKPVLQTAIAPTAPQSISTSNTPPPPPSYASSIQQKQQQQQPPPVYPPVNNVTPSPTSIPTTEPPSYATTMQALAAQRGIHHPLPPPPYSTPSEDTTIISSTMESGNASRTSPVPHHPPLQRKYSPADNCQHTMDAPSLSLVASTSISARNNNHSSLPENTVVGTKNSNSTKGDGSGSTPSSYKIKHQSPIPERKTMSIEKEEERRDCKVRNYSPQAFKFFMEQHVENILKSHKQRLYRRMQLETEMAKIGLSAEAQCMMRKMLSQKESNYIRLKRAKMDKSMFTKIKPIGVGAFGEVTLVRKLDTNQFYAMKTLRKADVLNRNQVAHVKAERDILAEADNEWVVKLYYSFQDKDNLYFVMDYIPGGDLMSLLIKLGIFKEPLARFYIAELTCAVESVHKMGFIHRDIKPDNILIDRDGHIKLTDFGLCTGFRWTHNSKYYQQNGHGKQDSMDPADDWNNECQCIQLKPLERRRHREHQRCLAHSLVGTPNYIAPEVLQRTGYTQLCDWWSVGVILYEMLVGSPPFLANTPAETQFKVINWETTLHIPKQANLSSESMDLILKLCVGADRRLGKNANEVKNHPFFASIDFEKGLRRQMAPHIPRIEYPTDTSNFDPVDPDKLRNSESSDSNKSDELLDNGKPFHGFFEFTFRRFFDDGGGPAYPSRISLDDNDNQGPVYV